MADLVDLDTEAISIATFVDTADLQSDETGPGVTQEPVGKFSPLESSSHDPSSCPVDERQSDRFRSVLRDPMPIDLLVVAG